MTLKGTEEIFKIISESIFPLLFTWIAPFYDLFIGIIIRDKIFINKYRKELKYLGIGQSLFIGPITIYLKLLSILLFNQLIGMELVICFSSIFLSGFLLVLVIFLKLGPEKFDRQIKLVRYAYAISPAIVLSITVIISFIK
jgi:hypothetical protein